MYFLRIPQRVCMSLSLFVCVYVGVRVCVCDTCRHAAAEDKAQLLLPASAAAFAVAVGIAASSCLGCGGRKWRQCQRRRQNFWQTLVFMCVCVRDSLCACVCVCGSCGVRGKGGVTCACVVSSSTFMSLVSLGLRCCFTCSFTVIYHKNILYSHFYKLFCFTPTTTHTLTHIPHTHTRVGRATFL